MSFVGTTEVVPLHTSGVALSQPLKLNALYGLFSARLKSCPDTRHLKRNNLGRSARARAGTPTRQPIWRSALQFHLPWVGSAGAQLIPSTCETQQGREKYSVAVVGGVDRTGKSCIPLFGLVLFIFGQGHE